MRTASCLFGNVRKGPLYALHFPLGEMVEHRLKESEIGLLLTRSGPEPATGMNARVVSERHHEGILVVFKRSLLVSLLEPFRPGIDSRLRAIMEKEIGAGLFAPSAPQEVASRLFQEFVTPSLHGVARSFYLEAKTKELIAYLGFNRVEQETKEGQKYQIRSRGKFEFFWRWKKGIERRHRIERSRNGVLLELPD